MTEGLGLRDVDPLQLGTLQSATCDGSELPSDTPQPAEDYFHLQPAFDSLPDDLTADE